LCLLIITLLQLRNYVLLILLIAVLAQLETGLNFVDRDLEAYNSFRLGLENGKPSSVYRASTLVSPW